MRRILYIILLIIVIVVLLSIMKSSKQNNNRKIPILPTPTVYSFRDNNKEFMDGCLESGRSTKDYCLCTWNYLNDNYTPRKITELSLDYMKDSSIIPSEFIDAAKSCLKYL